ncbi:MAG: hypothetical protein V5A50_14125, partial [Thiohalorhabdus sp.]|uniref:hypothetical protein n=1 Tax=Thiohalorhabdus sp. TaxID=3094134 RepID=UPI002FC38379
MSQMPVQFNPAAPSPSTSTSGGGDSSAKSGGAGFDRALQQAATGKGSSPSGGGDGSNRLPGDRGASRAEGSVRLEGARQAGGHPGPGNPGEGKAVPGRLSGNQDSEIAHKLAQLGLKGGQPAVEGEGGDRLMAMIRDLLGQGRADGQTVLDLLAQFREGDSEASLAELLRADAGKGQSDKAARFAAILSQMGGGDGADSGKAGEGAASLSALSLGSFSVLGDAKTGATGLKLVQPQSGGKQGLNSLANLLGGQWQGQGGSAARGEGEAGKGMAGEGSARDSA